MSCHTLLNTSWYNPLLGYYFPDVNYVFGPGYTNSYYPRGALAVLDYTDAERPKLAAYRAVLNACAMDSGVQPMGLGIAVGGLVLGRAIYAVL